MAKAFIVDRFYEDAEREIALRPGMTIYEIIAQLHREHPSAFVQQEPDRPLAVFPDGIRFRLPTAVIANSVDGEPAYVRQSEWHTRTIPEGETVAFVAMPRGGGDNRSSTGKQVAGLVGMIALTIAAPYLVAGLGLAGASFLGTAASSLTLAGRLAATGIVLGGAALLNALTPKPDVPNTASSQVYTANASGNSSTPLGVVPSVYGEMRYPPPVASDPYQEYIGNDQYLYQLFAISCGEGTISKIEFSDTEAWNAEDGYTDSFEGLEFEFLDPGDEVTLFPAGVVTADEVTGQEIPTPTSLAPFTPNYLGPFTVNAAGEANRINRIAIDFIMPDGLYAGGASIGLFGADLAADYRRIDDSGAPIGDWVQFVGPDGGLNGGKRYQNATKEPQRFTESVAVTTGRYQVRVYATWTMFPPDADVHNRTLWGGLKGYLADFTLPDGVTHLAMKVRANEDFSQLSANQVFVTFKRKLPIYNSDTEVWSNPTETASISWAVADILRNPDYGGNISDALIDLDWLAAYAPFWATRGDEFNAIVDREWPLIDLVNAMLRCGRAQVVRLGGRIGFVRDEAKDIRRQVFSPRNIVKGSFWHEFMLHDTDLPDSIYAKYLSRETWQEEEVKAVVAGVGSTNPVEQDYYGITDREHAWREAVTEANWNYYRRELVGFVTEWEGRILARGDPIVVDHPLMGTAAAQLVGFDELSVIIDRDIAKAPVPQHFDTPEHWTAAAAGTPDAAAPLSYTPVDDGTLNAPTIQVAGANNHFIRGRNVVEVPVDGSFYEVQITWRVLGAMQGRVMAQCISLNTNYGEISTVDSAWTSGVAAGAGVQLTRFFFAPQDGIAGPIDGTLKWAQNAVNLRFGINVNGAGDVFTGSVRISQIRVRKVFGLTESVFIRTKNGKEWGPCLVDAIPTDRTIALNPASFSSVVNEDGNIGGQLPGETAEQAHVILFQNSAEPFNGLVVSATPQGDNRFDVVAIRDAPEPYAADGTSTPPPYLPPPKPPKPPERPIVTGLYAYADNDTSEIRVHAGWTPAAGARLYVADVSYDAGDSWTRVYRDTSSRFVSTVLHQEFRLRVAAIGKFRGPYAFIDISEIPPVGPPIDNIPPQPPTNPTATAGFKFTAIGWTNASDDDLDGVEVWRGVTTSIANAVMVGYANFPMTTFVDSGLSSNTTYHYWLRSRDTSGNVSVFTSRFQVTTLQGTDELANEAVGPDQIADLAVLSSKLANLAVTTAKIAHGAITHERIAANAVIASKLAVTDLTNMFLNPTFLDEEGNQSAAHWTPGASSSIVEFSASGDDAPTRFGVILSPSAANSIFAYADKITVKPGEEFAVSYDYRTTTVNAGQNILYCQIILVDKSGGQQILNVDQNNIYSTAWTVRAFTFRVPSPSSVVDIRFRFVTTSSHTVGQWRVTRPIMRRAANGEMIVDGSITAIKILVGSLTGDRIAANQIAVSQLIVTDMANLLQNMLWEHPVTGDIDTTHWQPTGTVELLAAASTFATDAPTNYVARFLTGTGFLNYLGNIPSQPADGSTLDNDGNPQVGEEYAFSIELRTNSAAATLGTMAVQIIPVLKNGAIDPDGAISGFIMQPSTTWKRYTFILRNNGSPKTTRLAFRIFTSAQHTAGQWVVSRPIMRRASNGELIVDGTISTRHLRAESITGDKIIAGQITAGHIAANQINSSHIVAGNILARHIRVTNQANLLLNVPWQNLNDGSLDSSYWSLGANTSFETNFADSPTRHSLLLSAAAGNKIVSYNEKIFVSPGETFTIGVDLRRSNNANGNVACQILSYNRTDATPIATTTVQLPITANNQWVKTSGQLTVPNNPAIESVTFRLLTGAAHSSGLWRVTKPILQRASDASLIVDGSVKANHLEAKTITADQIAVGALNATNLFVNGIIITDLIAMNAVQAPRYANPANQNWSGKNSGTWYDIASVEIPVVADTSFVEGQFTCITTAAMAGAGSIQMFVRIVINNVVLYTEEGAARTGSGSTSFSNKGFGFSRPPNGDRVVRVQAMASWDGSINLSGTSVSQIFLKATAPRR